MQKTFSNLIFFFVSIAVLFSCSTVQKTNNTTTQSTNPPNTKIKYLALGDSYTIGESVKIRERYPIQLAEKIEYLSQDDIKNEERGTRVYFEEPKIIAKTGWTCEDLLAAIRLAEQKKELQSKYDIVSLLIGVNDQYRNYDSSLYEKRFEKLLEKAISLAGTDPSKVFVISIPDWGVTQYAKTKKMDAQKVAKEIDFYNKINKQIALKHKVKYFDITPISRKASSDKNLIAKDGLHPSAEMYKKWVDLIENEILEMVSN